MSAATRAWLAGPDEAEAVARLLVGFRDWYGRSEPPDDTFLAGVERLIVRPDTEYLLAAAAGSPQPRRRVPAALPLRRLDRERGLLARGPVRHRGRTAARALARRSSRAAIERARERGCGRIELDVSESNRAAWALYERMGFSAGYKPPAPNILMGLKL